MSLLFTIESKIVKPYTETLLISPFREIWERDTNAGKFTAIDEFTYIEFMTSVKKVILTEDILLRKGLKD